MLLSRRCPQNAVYILFDNAVFFQFLFCFAVLCGQPFPFYVQFFILGFEGVQVGELCDPSLFERLCRRLIQDQLAFMLPPERGLVFGVSQFQCHRPELLVGGEVFYQQIVQYMQETLGSQGVQLLLNKMSDRERKTEEADLKAKQAETGGSIDRYDSEMDQASQKSRQAAQEAENRQQQEGQISTQPAPTQPQADNPISIIKRIMKMGILELVLPPGREISTRTVSKDTMVSGRQLQQGMEMPDGVTADSSYTSGVLFQQYLMNHLGNYTDPSKESLAYQMEYVFGGRDNDIDNLKSVASKLLFIREGVNFACLMADNVKRTEAQALAAAIASGFLVPPAAVVIESALLLCWAFAESVLDVRELFAGGKIPLVKTSADWQISLSNLSSLMEGLDSMRKNNEHGLSYEDYLQVLILPVSKEKKVMRAMDMIEDAIRKKGRANFYMDSCVVALEAFAEVKANRKKEFQVIRQYCYE